MKMIKITLFVMMLNMMIAGMAFAGTASNTGPAVLTFPTAGITGFAGTALTVNPSTQVLMEYNGVAQAYGLTSQHLNGSRSFGGGSGDSSIYYKAKTAGTNTALSPSSVFSTTGWTAL